MWSENGFYINKSQDFTLYSSLVLIQLISLATPGLSLTKNVSEPSMHVRSSLFEWVVRKKSFTSFYKALLHFFTKFLQVQNLYVAQEYRGVGSFCLGSFCQALYLFATYWIFLPPKYGLKFCWIFLPPWNLLKYCSTGRFWDLKNSFTNWKPPWKCKISAFSLTKSW